METMGPVVAGSFYPAAPEVLRSDVVRLLAYAEPPPIDDLRALIVPHAGYVYSGPVAASAYALLDGRSFDRIALVGPSHFVWFEGLAQPVADTWRIPLGDFPLEAAPSIEHDQEPFASEHSLDVQLPFLHETLGPLPVVPILTGDITAEDTAASLDDIADGDTLLVISTDLSHYLPYDEAQRVDAMTTEAVMALEPKRLGRDSACGRIGLQAALLLARSRDWNIRLLDQRNSGDTAGDRSRVVGYGAFAIGR